MDIFFFDTLYFLKQSNSNIETKALSIVPLEVLTTVEKVLR